MCRWVAIAIVAAALGLPWKQALEVLAAMIALWVVLAQLAAQLSP
jgi:hypothetical protein